MPSNENHTEIWLKLKTSDQEALLALYNAHYVGLMNYGCKLTGDRTLTNDCITQVLLRLWDKRDKLPEVQNVRSYLLTCLRHELLAELRSVSIRAAKYKLLADEQSGTEQSWEEYIIGLQTNAAFMEKLARAMHKLTEREKELLQLKFFDDLDYDEIAARCSITKRTAYNIIHAAVRTLKAELLKQDKTLVVNPMILLLAIGLLS